MKSIIKNYSPDLQSTASITSNSVIDAHVHFWKYDKKRYTRIQKGMDILKQDYLPEHLSLSLKRNQVNGVVAVQFDESELETHFLVELAATHPVIKGVVGWIDLCKENIEERLQYFSQYSIIKGFRYNTSPEKKGLLLDQQFLHGIASLPQFNYTYDILVYPDQLKGSIELVSKFPEQKFVLDHCAKPNIGLKKIEEWSVLIKNMAMLPNIYCKLSGLLTEAVWKQWSPTDFYPYLDVIFNSFGAERVLFGSDWPVIILSGMYIQWKSLLEKYMEDFSSEDREKVFGATATRFYNL